MDNIDAQVVSELGGGLPGLLNRTAYTVASDAVVPAFEPSQNMVDGRLQDAAPQVVQQQGIPVAQPGTHAVSVPPTQPQGVDPAVVQQLQQDMARLAAGRIDAEEKLFEAQIAGLDPESQEFERVKRNATQAREVNIWQHQQNQSLRNELQQIRTGTVQQQQDMAKRLWTVIYAQKAGLDPRNEAVKATLSTANSKEEMQRIASDLATLVNGNHAQTAQAQANSGIFAAGGNNVSVAAPAEVKQRSGDLDGYLSQRGYQLVAER